MKRMIAVFVVILVLSGLLLVECKPYEIVYSSVFTTSKETEICLYVIVNSFLPVDSEVLAQQIIEKHRTLNGVRKNETYELKLYRTNWHRKRSRTYDTLFCNHDGKIIEKETY